MHHSTVTLILTGGNLPGRFFVDGRPAAPLADHTAVAQVAGDGCVVQFFPSLEADCLLPPATFALSLGFAADDACVDIDADALRVLRWPGGCVQVTLDTALLYAPPPARPSQVLALDWPLAGYTLALVDEDGLCAAVRDAAGRRLLTLPLRSSAAQLRCLEDMPPLALLWGREGDEVREVAALGLYGQVWQVALHMDCSRAQLRGDARLLEVVYQPPGLLRQARCLYDLRRAPAPCLSREYGDFTRPPQPPTTLAQAALSLLEAVRLDLPEQALSALAPDLAEQLSFAELKEYLGEQVAAVLPPPGLWLTDGSFAVVGLVDTRGRVRPLRVYGQVAQAGVQVDNIAFWED